MLIMLAESRHRRCKLLPHPAYAGLNGYHDINFDSFAMQSSKSLLRVCSESRGISEMPAYSFKSEHQVMSKPKIAIACHGGGSQTAFTAGVLNWHSPDNRECAKRVSLISCRDIGHSSYTGIIFRIARLLRLRLPRCGAAVVLRHTKTSDMGGSRTGQYRVGCDQDALLP